MSSESDQYVVEQATSPQSNEVLFKSKKWVYSVDSNSNGGSFGQEIQFDLGAIGAQADWTALIESQIDIPVFTAVKSNNATFASDASTTAFDKSLTVLKNGSHHFIHSAQMSVNGKVIQDHQDYLNIATHSDLMLNSSQEDMNKWGATLHMSRRPEDYDDLEQASQEAIFTKNGVNLLNTTNNASLKERMYDQNVGSGGLSSYVGVPSGSGRSVVEVKATGAITAGSITAGQYVYIKYDTITVRLKDIVPAVLRMPPVKNLRGYLYLKMNAITANFTTPAVSATTGGGAITLTSISNTAGSTCPVQLVGTNLFTYKDNSTTAAGSWTLTCGALGVNPSSTLTTPQPAHVNARLICPKYEANPAVDAALSMKKTFTILERKSSIVHLTSQAGNTFNINAGIANPRLVRVYPFIEAKGNATFTGIGNITTADSVYNPFLSIVDSAGSTTSPCVSLTGFNVYVGNKSCFQDSQIYDYEQFTQEIVKCGINGGMDKEVSSGLLNQTIWARTHRYYIADVSRRLSSEDGNMKSIQVKATNGTKCNLQLIVDVFAERELTIDTALCQWV